MLKAYKTEKAAASAAAGKPYLRVGDVYLVATDSDKHDIRFIRIELKGPAMEPGGSITVAMINAFSKNYKLPRLAT